MVWYHEAMKPSYLLIMPFAIVLYFVASGLMLYMNVAGYQRYWNEQNKKPATADALVYVALGDSAAQSIGARHPDQGYVGEFANLLEQKEGRSVHIINLSKSGARITDVLQDQIPELKKLKPDVVTIDIGGNDIASYDSARFKREFEKLLQELPAGTLVADVPYFGGRTQLPFFGSGEAEKQVQDANRIITDLVKPTTHKLVPLHDITQTHNGRWAWNYAIDYFHPSTRGYKAWTEAFWAAHTAALTS